MAVDTFNSAYYRRYYEDASTRVAEPAYFRRLAKFIAAYAAFLEVPVKTILDIGCGTGALARPLQKTWPRAAFTGVERSPYACKKFGWTEGSVVDWQDDAGFDLVVCHDVVQYLTDREAAAAIENLAGLTQGLLFFGVLTDEDWEQNCDQRRTDGDVYKRKDAWYRKRLRQHFRSLGGGLYAHRDADIVLFSLDCLD